MGKQGHGRSNLRSGNFAEGLQIVDPVGSLLPRYPADTEPAQVRQGLTRMLKVSKT